MSWSAPSPAEATARRSALDRLLDLRADHRLELAAVQPHRALRGRGQHRDGHLGVGCAAPPWPRCTRAARPRPRTARAGSVLVQPVERLRQPLDDVLEHHLVEVDAAEPLHALRPAEQAEARARPCGRRRRRTCRRRGRTRRSWSPARRARPPRSAAPRPAARPGTRPAGRGGAARRPSRSFLCAPHDAGWVTARCVAGPPSRCATRSTTQLHEPGREILGRPRPSAHEDRRRVADPPLELPDDVIGLAGGPPLGGLADEDAAVVAHVQHGRHGARPVAEVDDLALAGPGADAARRGSGAGGAHIDAQQVARRHARPPCRPSG